MELLYADKRIAVAVKPPGVLSTDEPGGMPELLRAQLGTPCIRTVHRLDAATGGVMVFARSAAAASILSGQVRDHRFRKIYLGVVRGDPGQGGIWRDMLGRDPVVVEGMDKGQPLLVPQAHGLGIGIVIHAVHQHHVGPIAAGGLDLGDRSPGGDTDGGGDLHIPGGKAHALGMVACGAGDNAPALLLVGQGGDLIVRAPQLEGPCLLQAVRLQIKVAVRHQARRVQHRGLVDNGGQHPACVLEHFHRDHIVASLILFYIQNPIFCSYAMYYHDTLSRRDCQFLFGQRAAFFAI